MSTAKTVFPGQLAPEFVLLDQNGLIHTLQHFRGSWVILYFYPKDHTPGCVKEAVHFQQVMRGLNKRNAKILGINMDEQTRHAEFAEKHQLGFPLLSDEDGSVCKRYSCLWSLGPLKIVRRKTFIINPAGIVVRIYQRVNPKTHSEQVLQDLDLQQTMVLSETG